jgi:radical SAM protein with 4Fe4S-binding SPASM domain
MDEKKSTYYELILADDCTRKCPFCKYCDRKGRNATVEEITRFFDAAFKDNGDKPFDFTMFGGEPTLNPKGIEHALCLSHNMGCRSTLITNADNFDGIEPYCLDFLDCAIISAYDYLDDLAPIRYMEIANTLRQHNVLVTFAYTMEMKDVMSSALTVFRYFCLENHVGCKINLSHSPESWAKNEKWNKVYETLLSNLKKDIDSIERVPDYLRFEKIRVKMLMEGKDFQLRSCMPGMKKVWRHGKFIGECWRMEGKKIPDITEIENCKECKWSKVCDRGCLAEIVEGRVDPRICRMQRAKFDAVEYGLSRYGNK